MSISNPSGGISTSGVVNITGGTINGAAIGNVTPSTGAFTTLSTTTSYTQNEGTANGVVYLNGSKVQTSSAGLTFDGTNAATTGTMTAAKLIPTGTSATGNGMYLPAANTLGWSVNGSEQMRLTSTGLRIGTSSITDPYGGVNHRLLNMDGTWGGVISFKIGATTFSSVGNRPSGNTGLRLAAYGATAADIVEVVTNGTVRSTWDVNGNWLPGADNTQNIGAASLRMKEIFAGTGTINTSDAREKTAVSALTASEKAAARDLALAIGSYQFLDSVERKGADNARRHIGMTVQRAIEIMESHGLNPFKYAFICFDEWGEVTEEVVSENGEFEREVTRQKVIEGVVEYAEVEVINGVPTRVVKTKTESVPQFDQVAVVDVDGNTVDGLTHPVPVMETVTERYDVIVKRPAGNRYGFREAQLGLFIAAGVLQS